MSEKKTKPKYSSVENVGWMIANAWRECRSVLLICIIIAVVSVALNLTELFIAPQILQRVENGAEVSSLLLTIVIFSGALFLLMGLKRYFEDNSLYGRIAVRTAIIVKINEKTNTTSYPNMLDSKIQKLRRQPQSSAFLYPARRIHGDTGTVRKKRNMTKDFYTYGTSRNL